MKMMSILAALPWYIARERNPWMTEVLLGILALYLMGWLGYRFRKRWRKRRRAHAWMARVHAIAEKDRLSSEEEKVLLAVLQRLDLSTPEASVESESYFDDFVYPRLSRKAGRQASGEIRRKLFGSPQPHPPSGPDDGPHE